MYFSNRPPSRLGSRWVIWLGTVLLSPLFVLGCVYLSRTLHAQERDSIGRHLVAPPPLPRTLSFAGEPVPLENADVRESLDRELCVAANWHSQMLQLLRKKSRYFPIIEPILARNGVPDDFKYLAVTESSLNELAVSPSHAVGLWQFLEGTAREYGLRVDQDVDERYNLEKATQAACDFLKQSYAETGNWAMAAATYNMGKGGVRRQKEKQQESSYYDLMLGRETGRYVFRIMALKLVMENPQDYGFSFETGAGYRPRAYREVQVDSTVSNLAEFAKSYGSSYKLLKWLNPWLRSNTLPVEEGQAYRIKVMDNTQRKEGDWR